MEQFAYHLLAEFEQLALTEKKPGASTAAAKGEHQVIRSWVPSINCRMKNLQIYHFRCFDTFWRSLSFEPKLSTFGFGTHWSGERIKRVQSMPTLCLSKWISSCSWCHPVSESVRKCCTFRYEMPYSTGIESSATVHGMFRNQKINSLSLAER